MQPNSNLQEKRIFRVGKSKLKWPLNHINTRKYIPKNQNSKTQQHQQMNQTLHITQPKS